MEKKCIVYLLSFFCFLFMSSVVFAIDYSTTCTPTLAERRVYDGTSRTLEIDTTGAPANGKITQVKVSGTLYSTTSQAIQDAACRFDSDSWPTDGPVVFYQNSHSGTGDVPFTKTFYSEFDNISPSRVWHIIFWNNVSATTNIYIVKDITVIISYTLPVQAPVVTISSVTPNPATTSQTVQGSGSGTNSPTSYEWKCFTHNLLLSTSSSFSKQFSAGSHNLQFKATNSAGSDTATQTLTVNQPAQFPMATIGGLSPNPATTSQTVSGSGSGTNSPTSYEWKCLTHNLLLSTTSSFSQTFSVGTHNLQFKATNSAGSDTRTTTLTVTSPSTTAPTAQIVSAIVEMIKDEDHTDTTQINVTRETIDLVTKNIPVRQYREISFSGMGTTPSGSYITAYQWYIENNGVKSVLSTSQNYRTGPMDLPSGNQTIYLKVQDSDGNWSTPVSLALTIKKFVKFYPHFQGGWKKSIGYGYNDNTHKDYSYIKDRYARDYNYGSSNDDFQKIYVCPFPRGKRWVPSFVTNTPWYSGWGKQIYIMAVDQFNNPITDDNGDPFIFGVSHCAVISIEEGEVVTLGQEIGSCGASTNGKEITSMGPHSHSALYVLRNGFLYSVDMTPLFLDPNDDNDVLYNLPEDNDFVINSKNLLKATPGKIVVDEGTVVGATVDPAFSWYGYDRTKSFASTAPVGASTVQHSWTPDIQEEGFYTIQVMVSYDKSFTNKAPYEIFTGKGEHYEARVDQNAFINEWVTLRTSAGQEKFYLTKGLNNYVQLSNGTGEQSKEITFDAVRFIKSSDNGGGGGNTTPTVTTGSAGGGGCALSPKSSPISILPLILLMIGGLLLQRFKRDNRGEALYRS